MIKEKKAKSKVGNQTEVGSFRCDVRVLFMLS